MDKTMSKLKHLRSFETFESSENDFLEKNKKQIKDWEEKVSVLKKEKTESEKAAKERQDEIDYIRKFKEPVKSK